MCSASLAAQFCTSALSIYYFHQFPLLFLFSNLLIIPLVSIALPLGLCSITLGQILPTKLLPYLFLPLDYNIRLVNFLVRFFADIPYHSIQGLFLSKAAFVALTLSMVFFGFAMEWKQRKLYYLFFAGLYSFLFIMLFNIIELRQQQELVFYQTRHAAEASLFIGNEEWHFTLKNDSSLIPIKNQAAPANRFWHNIFEVHEMAFPNGNYLIQYGHNKCLYFGGRKRNSAVSCDNIFSCSIKARRKKGTETSEKWMSISPWAEGNADTYLQNQSNNSIIDMRKHAAIILNL
jgi:hypothetical protein